MDGFVAIVHIDSNRTTNIFQSEYIIPSTDCDYQSPENPICLHVQSLLRDDVSPNALIIL